MLSWPSTPAPGPTETRAASGRVLSVIQKEGIDTELVHIGGGQ
jgi:hypothetical protein